MSIYCHLIRVSYQSQHISHTQRGAVSFILASLSTYIVIDFPLHSYAWLQHKNIQKRTFNWFTIGYVCIDAILLQFIAKSTECFFPGS